MMGMAGMMGVAGRALSTLSRDKYSEEGFVWYFDPIPYVVEMQGNRKRINLKHPSISPITAQGVGIGTHIQIY